MQQLHKFMLENPDATMAVLSKERAEHLAKRWDMDIERFIVHGSAIRGARADFIFDFDTN